MTKTPKTTTAPTGSIAPFGLRMLPELRTKIQESAKANGRSMNAEIVALLECGLDAAEARAESGGKDLKRLLTISNLNAEYLMHSMNGNRFQADEDSIRREMIRTQIDLDNAILFGNNSSAAKLKQRVEELLKEEHAVHLRTRAEFELAEALQRQIQALQSQTSS